MISLCCSAAVRVVTGVDDFPGVTGELHTCWYECTKCGKDCDAVTDEPRDQDQSGPTLAAESERRYIESWKEFKR
jgi:hypothetical protein